MKKPQDITGYKINCPNYVKCPICYGCRNYNPTYSKCVNNCNNKKDKCDTQKHRSDLIAKMLAKSIIKIK